MNLEKTLKKFNNSQISFNKDSVKELNIKLKNISYKCNKIFENLFKQTNTSGFFYGSFSRGDNVVPDVRKIISRGLDPLNLFWGNDIDLVMFNLSEINEVISYAERKQLDDYRFHIYYYRPDDVKRISEYFDQHIEGLPGDTPLFPYGSKYYKKVEALSEKLCRPKKDVFVINDRKTRMRVCRHYDYTDPLMMKFNVKDDARKHLFVKGESLRSAYLGLLVTQFLSTVSENGCSDLINQIKHKIDELDITDILLTNTRTLYDFSFNNKVYYELNERPRYLYDGFLKLFRNVFTKQFGTKTCCKKMNAIDFYEVLKGEFYENDLPVDDIRTALCIATSIKICARNPDYEDLVIKSGNNLIDDYLALCKEIDEVFFNSNL